MQLKLNVNSDYFPIQDRAMRITVSFNTCEENMVPSTLQTGNYRSAAALKLETI